MITKLRLRHFLIAIYVIKSKTLLRVPAPKFKARRSRNLSTRFSINAIEILHCNFRVFSGSNYSRRRFKGFDSIDSISSSSATMDISSYQTDPTVLAALMALKKQEVLALKRKRVEQSPPPPPKRQERENSYISISSDEDEPAAPVDSSPVLCQEQQELVDIILDGRNVFFTGSAGCGKSTALKTAIGQLQDAGRNVVVCAPTGIAALNVGGMTLHSYMGWNIDDKTLPLNNLIGKMRQKRSTLQS